MAETCMNESEVENFVDNFKGMLWDELEDALNCMSPEDMVAVILALKKRFG
ncbi:hypothetical protein [Methanobacterium formicicum]|uniref:hypothetical protein n=1 Tax=Methanobacterium formicicum TaxID=2162 RepID=UPI002FE325D8